MELKVKADDGQQIWLSKEDIYHGSLILVNAAACVSGKYQETKRI